MMSNLNVTVSVNDTLILKLIHGQMNINYMDQTSSSGCGGLKIIFEVSCFKLYAVLYEQNFISNVSYKLKDNEHAFNLCFRKGE